MTLAKNMKRNQLVAIISVLLVAFLVVACWTLLRRARVASSPSASTSQHSSSDDFSEVGIDQESGSNQTLDLSIREFLVGRWRCNDVPYIEKFFYEPPDGSDGSTDFVELSADGSCRFRLHEFEYEGQVTFERAYAGFFTEFEHNDKTHIFIFGVDGRTWEEESSERLAMAFVGHDPKPMHREVDYEGAFVRSRLVSCSENQKPNQDGDGDGE